MAINYPTSLDVFTNPTPVNPQSSPSHSQQHSDANDAIEALQAKVGVNNSLTASSLDYKVGALETDVSSLDSRVTTLEEETSGVRVIGIQVIDAASNTAVGDAKAYFRIPVDLNGMNLIGVAMTVYTAGTTNTTDVQIRNKTDSVDMLSTKLTIDSGETDSSTAATPAVIDTTKDDVATGDVLAIDIDAISTTAAKGLYVELRFQLP